MALALGATPVAAALANPERHIVRLLATSDAARELATIGSLPDHPRGGGRPPGDREPAATRVRPSGVAALARPLPQVGLDDLLAKLALTPSSLLVVLDQVTDPRNVGAVLRSAEAFGADAVLVQDRHAPEETGTLAKAASGSLERVPLVRCTNLARALRAMQQADFRCIGLAGEATETLDAIERRGDLRGRIALALGAEGTGLRRLLRETCDQLVRIAIAPTVESLNLSAAAAVALHACGRIRCVETASEIT
ncbi:MAG: RNA methyltransferase [Defluviicoccus sp.]|nr:MAG: RNA methyltransferase [Defluviicoccus sp.]